MEQWEYFSTFLEADADKLVGTSLNEPVDGKHPKHTPYSLIPELNSFGAQGWELVSMYPLKVGRNHDFGVPTAEAGQWGFHYFCAFKRRIA